MLHPATWDGSEKAVAQIRYPTFNANGDITTNNPQLTFEISGAQSHVDNISGNEVSIIAIFPLLQQAGEENLM